MQYIVTLHHHPLHFRSKVDSSNTQVAEDRRVPARVVNRGRSVEGRHRNLIPRSPTTRQRAIPPATTPPKSSCSVCKVGEYQPSLALCEHGLPPPLWHRAALRTLAQSCAQSRLLGGGSGVGAGYSWCAMETAHGAGRPRWIGCTRRQSSHWGIFLE